MKYILNSAVITTPGTYRYRLISLEEMIDWLKQGNWLSTIGYIETATALEELSGFSIPVNRIQIRMKKGDQALVFRLTKRIENVNQKGHLGVEEVCKSLEIGILEKIDNE